MVIKYDENIIKVIFENPAKEFIFDYKTEVKLTEFVIFISELESEILTTPESYEIFTKSYNGNSKEALKLIEYLYKIVNSFNESYKTVYPVQSIDPREALL